MKMITQVRFFVCLLCVALVNAKLNRILSGEKAKPGEYRYQISIQKNNNHVCGGAIIADQYVLTAAHCFIQKDNKLHNFQVVAGSTNLLTNEGVRVDVEKIYVLREFSPENKGNDIAVLKLHSRLGLESNPNLDTISLPSKTEPSHVDDTAVISGYGLTHMEMRYDSKTDLWREWNGRTDRILRHCKVNIVSNEECARKNYRSKITEKHICGQGEKSGEQQRAPCRGDSGGPLVHGNIIIGIYSTSSLGCIDQYFPAIYTRVSSFVDFITKAMKDEKSSDIYVREIHRGESSSSSSSKGHGVKRAFEN